MKQIQLGILGAGRIGAMHTVNIARYVPELRIRTVADPVADLTWPRRLGIDTVTRESDHIFADPAIDAVAIFTSTPAHAELVEAAISAGKHVFCEQPVALDCAALDRLDRLARAASVTVMVGLNRRFDPSFVHIQQAVARGDVGAVHIVRITNRDPARPDLASVADSGGLFMDFTVHDFDMARFVTGRDIVEVSAFGAALVDPAIAALGDIDTAIVTVRFDGGALGVIDNSREAVYGYDQRVEVFGSLGSVEARNATPTTVVHRTADRVTTDKPWDHFTTRYKQAYIAEMQAFARCLRDGAPAPVGLTDIREAVRAARAATRSLADRRPVSLADEQDRPG